MQVFLPFRFNFDSSISFQCRFHWMLAFKTRVTLKNKEGQVFPCLTSSHHIILSSFVSVLSRLREWFRKRLVCIWWLDGTCIRNAFRLISADLTDDLETYAVQEMPSLTHWVLEVEDLANVLSCIHLYDQSNNHWFINNHPSCTSPNMMSPPFHSNFWSENKRPRILKFENSRNKMKIGSGWGSERIYQ